VQTRPKQSRNSQNREVLGGLQLFTWHRLYASGALSAVGAGEEVIAASEYGALQHQVRELQRLLGKKTLENEILREALDLVAPTAFSVVSPTNCSPNSRGER
jgi:hypothetical protein